MSLLSTVWVWTVPHAKETYIIKTVKQLLLSSEASNTMFLVYYQLNGVRVGPHARGKFGIKL